MINKTNICLNVIKIVTNFINLYIFLLFILFLYNENSKSKKVNAGDYFCYRYIYKGKMCDVNYEIKSMKYTMFGGF